MSTTAKQIARLMRRWIADGYLSRPVRMEIEAIIGRLNQNPDARDALRRQIKKAELSGKGSLEGLDLAFFRNFAPIGGRAAHTGRMFAPVPSYQDLQPHNTPLPFGMHAEVAGYAGLADQWIDGPRERRLSYEYDQIMSLAPSSLRDAARHGFLGRIEQHIKYLEDQVYGH